MIDTTRHDWQTITARTPSGKSRSVKRCADCGLITYHGHGRLTVWQYADGHTARTAAADAPTCLGPRTPTAHSGLVSA